MQFFVSRAAWPRRRCARELYDQCWSSFLARLDFLKIIEANVPSDLNIHLVLDNYATHKHPKIKDWLAAHSRYQMHDTPKYASWLNQVKIWVNLIKQRQFAEELSKASKTWLRKFTSWLKYTI